ncbi:MAG: rhodanese-like domain-containing protein [Rickettsiales bacterium]|nr:rhodanese-like domain-containing protein [Rickettsiales bacterium]
MHSATASTNHPQHNALSQLLVLAEAHKFPQVNYAGELSPQQTYDYLAQQGGILIDVRTAPEWLQTGVPDTSKTKGAFMAASWKLAPHFTINPEFFTVLVKIAPETPLFFICRSGGRSLDAAAAMTERGYKYCFNVADGFEGAQPNTASSWMGAGLPIKQVQP